ncbi:MAG: signal peptidase II [Alistipes sp.]|nr:signal peptidase II [Alistipes sp.]
MTIILIAAIFLFVGADQLVKYWAVHTLQPKGSMDFIHFGDFEILDLTYLENRGAIFGSMAGKRWFLVGFTSLVIAAAVVYMFMSLKKSKFLSFSVMLFAAGGIGNLIDRIRLGYVVDMFEVRLFHFAIFNVADICVTCAFAMVLIYVIFIEPRQEKAKKAAAASGEASADE